MTETITVSLHKGQRAALEATAANTYMIAGSGGGKTVTGPLWLTQRIVENIDAPAADQQYLVASPNFPLLVRTTFPTLKPYMDAIGAKWHAGDRRFELTTGGSVWVGSAENPQSLEGVHVKAAWCDEFGQVEDLAHDTVVRRAAMRNGRTFFTTTPYRSTGWIRRIRDAAAAGDTTVAYITFPSWWNPAYPLAKYLELKRTLPPWQAAMFLDAELARPEGAIYPIFDESRHVVTPFVIPDEWERFAGYDHGASVPTAIIVAARSPEDVLICYDERYEANARTSQHGRWLQSRAPRPELVFIDPSAKQTMIDLRMEYDVPAYQADNAVLAGIDAVYERLAEGRLVIMAGTCANLRREIESYVWNANKDAPVKENDHAVDALRYLVMGVRQRSGRATVVFG